jgi:hypothetical protein
MQLWGLCRFSGWRVQHTAVLCRNTAGRCSYTHSRHHVVRPGRGSGGRCKDSRICRDHLCCLQRDCTEDQGRVRACQRRMREHGCRSKHACVQHQHRVWCMGHRNQGLRGGCAEEQLWVASACHRVAGRGGDICVEEVQARHSHRTDANATGIFISKAAHSHAPTRASSAGIPQRSTSQDGRVSVRVV